MWVSVPSVCCELEFARGGRAQLGAERVRVLTCPPPKVPSQGSLRDKTSGFSRGTAGLREPTRRFRNRTSEPRHETRGYRDRTAGFALPNRRVRWRNPAVRWRDPAVLLLDPRVPEWRSRVRKRSSRVFRGDAAGFLRGNRFARGGERKRARPRLALPAKPTGIRLGAGSAQRLRASPTTRISWAIMRPFRVRTSISTSSPRSRFSGRYWRPLNSTVVAVS